MPNQKLGETVERALATLQALHPKKIDLGLDRIERVLKELGNPQDKLPPTIHIAGTNGKGSTVAYLRAFAEAAGLKAHVYTSPHLVHFRLLPLQCRHLPHIPSLLLLLRLVLSVALI